MRAKLPLLLLGISLAFNMFFVAGFFQAYEQATKARTLRGRAAIIAQKLELNQEQYEQFQGLVGEFEQLRQKNISQREALLAELIKDEPDEEVLEQYCEGGTIKQHRKARLSLVRRFMNLLRPEQREAFAEIIEKRNSPSK